MAMKASRPRRRSSGFSDMRALFEPARERRRGEAVGLLPLPEILQTIGSTARNAGLVGMGAALAWRVRADRLSSRDPTGRNRPFV